MDKNRVHVMLPLYGVVQAKFLINWLNFQGQISRYDKYAGMIVTEVAPVDLAMNNMVRDLLKNPKWDYALVVEQDMIVPEGFLERIGTLDPATHPIVGCLYFGRTQENQNPIPGHWINGQLHRLSYEEVCPMLPQRGGTAGLHKVDTVGMGVTAIHRSVFENWPYQPSFPWFRFDYDQYGPIGHDVWFCVQAGRQGYPVYVDSEHIAEHIGDWRSNVTTYLATAEFAMGLRKSRSESVAGVVIPWVGPNGLRMETVNAVAECGFPTAAKEMLEEDSYYKLIEELWADGETFITVEQDIVPAPGDIRQLAECPEPWCAFAYEYPPFGLYAGMGLAKFSADLIKQFPDAMKITGGWHDAKHGPAHWCTVDAWLKKYLTDGGARQHIHGIVTHLHKGGPAHGCVTTEEAERIIAAQRAA
jgi:hypothetical protein